MIKAKKGLLIALFAAMMVFAFGATSAFAAQYDSKDASGNDLMLKGGTVTDIVWDTEAGKSATLEVTTTDNQVSTFKFDYKTQDEINAIRATRPSRECYELVVFSNGEHNLVQGQNARMMADYRALGWLKYTVNDNGTGSWTTGNPRWINQDDLNWSWGEFPLTDQYIDVLDMSRQDFYKRNANNTESATYVATGFNGGDYAAWLALKDSPKDDFYYLIEDEDAQGDPIDGELTKAARTWIVSSVFTSNPANEDYAALWTADYEAYNAFSYDTEKNANKKVKVTVTPNVDAIKAWVGGQRLGNVAILETPKVFEWEANATNLGVESKDYWTDWAIDAHTTAPIEGMYEDTYYDGTTRTAAFTHPAEAVTYKFAVEPEDKYASAADVPADDWTDAVAIKDFGDYDVFVKMSMDRYPKGTEAQNRLYTGVKSISIYKFPILMGFLQSDLKVEYGKYDKTSLEAAVKNLFMYSTNAPDSKEAIAEVIEKYGVVVGLFTDAGKNKLYADVDDAALTKDATLAAAVANYDFAYAIDYDDIANYDKFIRSRARVGVPNEYLTLEITQVANTVDFGAVSKTYKAKALKKKAKSFQLNATATYGEVKYTKVSGSTKIKVSKTGKVTVKKGTKKGNYKVKVKAYVNGTANYSKAAQTVKLYIKVK